MVEKVIKPNQENITFTAKTRHLSMESNKNSTNDNDQKNVNIGGEKNSTINLESQAGEIYSTIDNIPENCESNKNFSVNKINDQLQYYR